MASHPKSSFPWNSTILPLSPRVCTSHHLLPIKGTKVLRHGTNSRGAAEPVDCKAWGPGAPGAPAPLTTHSYCGVTQTARQCCS